MAGLGKRHKAWMQMFPADWTVETGLLSCSELGAYMRLCWHLWASETPLPDQDEQLARIARMSLPEWSEARPGVSTLFVIEDGEWRSSMIDGLLSDAQQRYEQKANAGRKGGQAKRKQKQSSASSQTQQPDSDSQPQSEAPIGSDEENDPLTPPPFLDRRNDENGTRLPTRWSPDPKDCEFAKEQGLDDKQISREVARFKDHYASKAGQDGIRADWSATWRNWIRRAPEFSSRSGSGADGGKRPEGDRSGNGGVVAAARGLMS